MQSRRDGKRTFYKLNPQADGATGEFIQLAIRGAKELPEHAGDQINLKRVLARRREQAQVYFNQVAGRFDRVYGPGRSWQAFGHLLLRILPPLVVADLGAGEGLLSELLARRCKKVIAVDNSEKIVAFGAAKAKKNGLKNLEFRLGDLQNPPIEAGQRGPRDFEPGVASRGRSGRGDSQRAQNSEAGRADFDSRFAQAQFREGAANFTATAGRVLPKAICTAGWKTPASRKSKSASSPARNSRRISRPFWRAGRKTNRVAQAFQPAGSRDIPVECFKSLHSRFASKMATGKSPEPADKNVCVTPPRYSPVFSARR